MYLTALNPACVELLLKFCKAAIISISVESILNKVPAVLRIFILIPMQACGQLNDKVLANDFPFGDGIHNYRIWILYHLIDMWK